MYVLSLLRREPELKARKSPLFRLVISVERRSVDWRSVTESAGMARLLRAPMLLRRGGLTSVWKASRSSMQSSIFFTITPAVQ